MASRDYIPPLDGIRALAIAAVVAYHLGYLRGGWIGVDLFFVLSGYLITSILLDDAKGWGRLKRFWGRRFKRLVPAVLTLLLVLSLYARIGGPGLVPAQLRVPALATLFYGANWQQIVAGHSYFAQFFSPSPLEHTWSLAIEEQYYLAWPLLLGALLWATRRSTTATRRRTLAAATLSLTVASAVWMGVAAHLFGANRAYLGTDTRAWELLLGGLLAILWPANRVANRVAPRSRLWSTAAAIGILGVIAGASTAGGPPAWVWDGGLVAIAVSGGLLIIGTVLAPAGGVARLLSLAPVRWLGRISYSLYLWHWPAIVLITPENTSLSGTGLLAARLAAMLTGATASYYLVERPLRAMDWASIGRRLRLPAVSFASAGLLTTGVLVIAGTIGPAAASSAPVVLPILPASVSTVPLRLSPATPARPYRVWLVGDSVMGDAAPGVTAALEATGDISVVADSTAGGWGLTTDPGWPGDAWRIVQTDHPQIVMGTWSWDDSEAALQPAIYLQRLETAMRRLLSPGSGVEAIVLIQFPQIGPITELVNHPEITPAWKQTVATQYAWNRAAQQAVKAFPGQALYVPTAQLFAPGGRFLTWMRTTDGRWVRARKLDDAHLCPYGAAEFGGLLVQDLTPQLHLAKPKPGWEFGPWTHAHRYDQPPGACPNDQPPPGYRGTLLPSISPTPPGGELAGSTA